MKELSRCFRRTLKTCRPTDQHIAWHQRRRPRMLSSAEEALLTELLHRLESAELLHTSENELWLVFYLPSPGHPAGLRTISLR